MNTTVDPRTARTWQMENGRIEKIVEIEDEPRHLIDFVSGYTRIITTRMPPNDTTLAHRHTRDTIIIICMENGIDFINDVLGSGAQHGHMDFGQVSFAPYKSSPCVHKITNLSSSPALIANIEILQKPPISNPHPMVAPSHELVCEKANCRVYKVHLEKHESVQAQYPFYHVLVILKSSEIQMIASDGTTSSEHDAVGCSRFQEPLNEVRICNIGDSVYEAYICELV